MNGRRPEGRPAAASMSEKALHVSVMKNEPLFFRNGF